MKYKELMIELNQLNNRQTYINKIKRNSYSFIDLPQCLFVDKEAVYFYKDKGYFLINKIGYDVLKCYFYADISIDKPITKKSTVRGDDHINLYITFNDFDDYFNYLDGDIYNNACYFGLKISPKIISKYNINLSKINYESLIDETIDDFGIELSSEEKKEYKEIEKTKKIIVKWIDKIEKSHSQGEFDKVMNSLIKSHSFINDIFINVIINQMGIEYFNYLFEYVNNHYTFIEEYVYYVAFYKYGIDFFNDKIKNDNLKKYIIRYKERCIPYQEEHHSEIFKGFSSKTHFFYVLNKIDMNHKYGVYFDNFDDFTKYLNNDLSDCCLANWVNSSLNFDNYKKNKNTILPINSSYEYEIGIKKLYSKKKDIFVVVLALIDNNGNIVKSVEKVFDQFADFIKYINYDLSNADIVFCDELINIPDLYKYNINKAYVRSNVLIKNNIGFKAISINQIDYNKDNQLKNEELSIDLYNNDRELSDVEKENDEDRKIYYISDLHLEFRLLNENVKTEIDEFYVLTRIAEEITENYASIVIITGDVADDLELFKKFLKILAKNKKSGYYEQSIIFTLGNHELWPFCNQSIDYIVAEYKNLIESYGFYLLQNELMCYKINKWVYYGKDIINSNYFGEVVKNEINSSEIILFGGLGFAGKNEIFNANCGIYLNAIKRPEEIRLSIEFENLYNKIVNCLGDYSVIVATHMPLSDWAGQEHHKNFIYLSGHTHKNKFYDDGEIRIYSDNQVGYSSKSYKMKYFYLDDSYDLFKYYEDGIYPITVEQYKDFYYGKRIGMTFNRDFIDMFVIKKKGYYMFVHEYQNSLCILNGGAEKKLSIRDKEYYYDNLITEIEYVKGPLDEYTKVQEEVSKSIKQFGGDGTIHGAIVDISYWTHVYVNPYDLKLTFYYALDVIDKTVYKSLPDMLKQCEKQLYINYKKMISEGKQFEIDSLNSIKFKEKSIKYYDTDIYKASRKIKQMQKLQNNIIAIWVDLPNQSDYLNEKLKKSIPTQFYINDNSILPKDNNQNILKEKVYNKVNDIKLLSNGDIVFHINFGEGIIIDISNKKETIIKFNKLQKKIDIEYAVVNGYIVGKK